jgi:hypothetical protein
LGEDSALGAIFIGFVQGADILFGQWLDGVL